MCFCSIFHLNTHKKIVYNNSRNCLSLWSVNQKIGLPFARYTFFDHFCVCLVMHKMQEIWIDIIESEWKSECTTLQSFPNEIISTFFPIVHNTHTQSAVCKPYFDDENLIKVLLKFSVRSSRYSRFFVCMSSFIVKHLEYNVLNCNCIARTYTHSSNNTHSIFFS